MKISISQTELQNAVSVVAKGLSSRSTLPILSGILLQASQDQIIFQTTDLDKSIKYSCDALIEEEGEIVVPGKLFSEIVKNLPDAAVSINVEGESAIITCNSSSFSIKTLPAQDFPGFPKVETYQHIEIPFDVFSSMVKKVSRVVSKDESRAILTGILISLENNHLKLVATDSYRLAITEADIERNENSSFEAVIAGSFLSEITSLPRMKEPISLALSENQVIVKYQNTVFVNRRIEGSFPNYRQLLPESYETKIDIDTQQLIAAVRRISLLDTVSAPIRFDFNNATQTVQLSSIAQDVGSAQETLSCEIEGGDNEIAFNYAYVLDGLTAAASENISIEIQNSAKPGILKTEESEKFLYLIMPVRLS